MNIDPLALRDLFVSNLNSLKDFQFTFYNPLFWGIMFILFMVLRWLWDTRNAFTFSLLSAVILLVATELESHLSAALANAGELYDAAIIRLASLVVVAVLFLAYAFLRK